MGIRKVSIIAAVVIAGLGLCSPAQADFVSFTYSDLDGDFAAGVGDNGTFTATDQTAVLGAATEGDVSRLVPVVGSAVIDFGDAGIGSGDFSMTIAVSSITATTADGVGTFSLTDVDGDTLSGTISGFWIKLGSAANFVGLISGASFAGGDGSFDGTSGTPFSTTLPGTPPYPGNIFTLASQGWFTTGGGTVASFDDKTTLASGVIVPAPGAALLGMIGLGAAGWVRRRFA